MFQGVECRRLAHAAVAGGCVERQVSRKLVGRSIRYPRRELVVQLSHSIARCAMARTRAPNGPSAMASGAAAV